MGEANEAAETTDEATLTAAADQNGTQEPVATLEPTPELTLDPEPLATELADAAVEETEKFIPSLPPDAAEALKGWLRLNIIWVQTEMEHAKLGTPVEDRAKLNP